MKSVRYILAIMAIVISVGCTLVGAKPVTLAWDHRTDASSWTVMRGIESLVTVSTPTAIVDLPDGENSVITVIARNEAGVSPPSLPLYIFISALPVCTIQFSTDLINWSETPSPGPFFRVKITRP